MSADVWDEIAEVTAAQGRGNCYEAAVTLLLSADALGLHEPVVCHGVAVGQGPIEGKRFGHAWLEAGNAEWPEDLRRIRLAYDYSSGKTSVLPADMYRQMGQVEDVHEYTLDDVRRMMNRYGHYGPWVAHQGPVAYTRGGGTEARRKRRNP